MARFTLQMRANNAAFDDGNRRAEVARILRHVANQIEHEGAGDFYTTVRDLNGNDVGRYKLFQHGEG